MNDAPNSVPEFRMAYEDSCDRVPVLLIHGYPLNNLMWDLQIGDLSDIARMIAPDLRGFGMTDPTEPPYSMQTFADDCAALLDQLGITVPIVVAGLSMGGYVAFEFCRRHPERVAGLILTATWAGADSAEARDNRDKAAGVAIAEGAGAIAEGMLPKLLAPDNYAAQPDLVDFLREMMLETSVDGIVGAQAAMRDRPDSTTDLPALDVPTLIVHGAEDQIIPVAEAEAMAKALPKAKLVVVPGAGHMPNLENPEAFNDAVREFLDIFYGD
ncbi:MAG: alpha/beta fold hydrolase [Candidatus Krumholzibacteriota bacterium]